MPKHLRTLIACCSALAPLLALSPQSAAQQSARPAAETTLASFAGGCFWCMEPPFDKLDGVLATVSGYTGGQQKKPSYEEVSSGRTDHAEAVQVR